VSARTPAQFSALCERLERASRALRDRGCLLQAIARRYYVAFTIATYLAAKCGITALRKQGSATATSDQFTHNEFPDLVRALYTGGKSGSIGPAAHSGLIGASLTETEAVSYAHRLQFDRKLADYGYIDKIEPYDVDEADQRLDRANQLIADLRSILDELT
jgi:hypothetical protein